MLKIVFGEERLQFFVTLGGIERRPRKFGYPFDLSNNKSTFNLALLIIVGRWKPNQKIMNDGVVLQI